jgi:hypothetical protein
LRARTNLQGETDRIILKTAPEQPLSDLIYYKNAPVTRKIAHKTRQETKPQHNTKNPSQKKHKQNNARKTTKPPLNNTRPTSYPETLFLVLDEDARILNKIMVRYFGLFKTRCRLDRHHRNWVPVHARQLLHLHRMHAYM